MTLFVKLDIFRHFLTLSYQYFETKAFSRYRGKVITIQKALRDELLRLFVFINIYFAPRSIGLLHVLRLALHV
jgi:hypothetical protein